MNRCKKCTAEHFAIPQDGNLYIVPPQNHTLSSLRRMLAGMDIRFTDPEANLLKVSLAGGVAARLSDVIREHLSEPELRDTRSLFVAEGKALELVDIASIQSLYTWVSRVQGEWFAGMLSNRRFTSHFHPIVHADDPEVIFGHECLLRGLAEDGSLVPPDRLYRAARDADVMFPLDREARLAAIRCAAEHHLDTADSLLFINFNPTSIYDPKYCLRTTIDAISRTNFAPSRIVFEVVESDHIRDFNHLKHVTEFYREAGFRIALDDLGSGYGSLNLLGGLRPDFVKLDMELIRDVDRDPYKAGIVRNLLRMARELGVETVAEGIETEEEWEWARDNGADYLQGFLFGRPASVPNRPKSPARREAAAIGGP